MSFPVEVTMPTPTENLEADLIATRARLIIEPTVVGRAALRGQLDRLLDLKLAARYDASNAS